MFLIEESAMYVYLRSENVFVYLPIMDYVNGEPVVAFNNELVKCDYTREKLYDAYRMDPRTGAMLPVYEAKNFWYI